MEANLKVQKDYLGFLPAEIDLLILDSLYVAKSFGESRLLMNYKDEIHDSFFKTIFPTHFSLKFWYIPFLLQSN